MNVIRVVSFLLISFAVCASTAKILVVCPTQMRSHYLSVEQLLRELAESGHEITVVSQFAVNNPPTNYRELVIDVSRKSYEGWFEPSALDHKLMAIIFQSTPRRSQSTRPTQTRSSSSLIGQRT